MLKTQKDVDFQETPGDVQNNNSQPVKMKILYGMLPRRVMKNWYIISGLSLIL